MDDAYAQVKGANDMKRKEVRLTDKLEAFDHSDITYSITFHRTINALYILSMQYRNRKLQR